MSAQIVVPWFDPLGLVDSFCRLVLDTDDRDLVIYAHTGSGYTIPKGVKRSRWDEAYATSANASPIVTYLPFLGQNRQGPWYLAWKPLEFRDLPRWLAQLHQRGYEPTALENLTQFGSMASSLRHAAGTNMMNKQRVQREALATFLMSIAHPDSHLPTSAEESNAVFTALTIAQLIQAETTGTFLPLTRLNVAGAFERVGHIVSTGGRTSHITERHQWRQRQGHGYSRHGGTLAFYGKQWMSRQAQSGALYAGVEVEMELANAEQSRAMSRTLFAICDEFGLPTTTDGGAERLHIEGDSSLPEHGLEVVLMPHEVHSLHGEQFWRRIYKTACLMGASNTGARAGMHIHVSAKPALEMPRGMNDRFPSGMPLVSDDYRQTTALLIDLSTAMLAGGPLLWLAQPISDAPGDLSTVHNRAMQVFNDETRTGAATSAPRLPPFYPVSSSERGGRRSGSTSIYDVRDERQDRVRFATHVFGRPQRWDGSFATPYFSLMRPEPNTQWDRYRHVNWNNTKTIEFRIFGPLGFDQGVDWINVATQLTSAIVHFSRATSLSLLAYGSSMAHANQSVEQFFLGLPDWLQPMLLITNTDPAFGGDAPTQALRMGGCRLAGSEIGMPHGAGGVWAVEKPATSIGSPYRIGMAPRGNHSEDSRWLWGQATTQLGAPRNAALHTARTAELYIACMHLWRRFVSFLQRNSPQYDLLLSYLEREVIPALPTDAQLEAVSRLIRPDGQRATPTPPAPAPARPSAPVRTRPLTPMATPEERLLAMRQRALEDDAPVNVGGLEDLMSQSMTVNANSGQAQVMVNRDPGDGVLGSAQRLRDLEQMMRLPPGAASRVRPSVAQAAAEIMYGEGGMMSEPSIARGGGGRRRRRTRAQIDADNAAAQASARTRAQIDADNAAAQAYEAQRSAAVAERQRIIAERLDPVFNEPIGEALLPTNEERRITAQQSADQFLLDQIRQADERQRQRDERAQPRREQPEIGTPLSRSLPPPETGTESL